LTALKEPTVINEGGELEELIDHDLKYKTMGV
jgi:hypothetical protein